MHSEDRITHTAPSTSPVVDTPNRSEEHTSELQSRLHLVCRLLLEKKKKNDHIRAALAQHNIPISKHVDRDAERRCYGALHAASPSDPSGWHSCPAGGQAAQDLSAT